MHKMHCIHQGLVSQQERTLESQPAHLVIFTCKDTIAPGSVDYQLKMLNFKLYIYIKARFYCIWISGLPVENVEL